MTNEQLAALIQAGDAPELLPILWERTKRYLYKLAGRACSAYKESCDRAGIVMDDLRQGCYEAFLQAVGAYKPESGFAFLSFTAYPFKNVLHSMLGIRTRRRDPLNECSSLDAPADPEGESTFLELLPDPEALPIYTDLEEQEDAAAVHAAVERLKSPVQRRVICLCDFSGMSQKAAGEALGVSGERVRQIRRAALRELRKDPVLQQLYLENCRHSEQLHLQRIEFRPDLHALYTP